MIRTKARNSKRSKTPKKLSIGEETLALHLDAFKIPYQREVKLIPGRDYRWDFYFREIDLALEISGGTWHKGGHSSGSGILRDYRKNNAATLAGIKTLYFTTEQVTSGEAIGIVMQALGL